MVKQDEIISVIRQKGPLLPSTLAKKIGTNILIASAHLSDLVDKKRVFVSSIKVGGSPVYYVEGQKPKLQDFSSNLNEKDQKTFELLKNKKILRDDELGQLERVSLRNIKDFAVPLQVTRGEEKVLFWKWYLLSNQEAESLIKQRLETKKEVNEVEKPQRDLNNKKEEVKSDRLKEKEETKREKQDEKKEEKNESNETEKKSEQNKDKGKESSKKAEEENKKVQQKKEDKEKQKENARIEKEKKKLERERKKIEEERKKLQEEIKKERQSLLKEIEEKRGEGKEKKKKIDDPFFKELVEYLENKRIQIKDYNIVRKKSEIDMVLKVPSVLGDLDYYCKARKKKRVSDSDLSSAIVKGQSKNLPIIFLTTGKLNRKAKKLFDKELKGSMVIKKI